MKNINANRKNSLHYSLMDTYEKIVISEALKLNKNNQSKTAKYLGLSRTTLITKLKKHSVI